MAERLLAATVFFVVLLSLLLGLAPFGAATSPDSLRYLEVAQHIEAGEGIVITDHDAGADDRLRAFTKYPPLYPLAVTMFLGPNTPATHAAARLALLTLFVSAFLFYELLRPLTGFSVALAGTLLFLVSQPILTVFSFAWSESLAIPLWLFSAWCCLRCLAAAREGRFGAHIVYLGLLVLGLTAAAYARYIAVLFAALLPMALLISPRRKQWRRSYLFAVVAYGGLVGLLYLRNYSLTGHFSGAVRYPPPDSLATNAADALRALLLQVATRPSALVMAAIIAIAVALVTRHRWSPRPAPSTRSPSDLFTFRVLCWVCFTTYVGGLVLLRTLRSTDRIDTRLISPAFVFLLMLLIVEARRRAWTARSLASVAGLGALVLVLVLVATQGLATYHDSLVGWATDGSPRFPMTAEHDYYNYTISPAGGVAAQLVQADQYMDGGRFPQAIEALTLARATNQNEHYAINKSLARSHAGLGDVSASLAHTRACLAMRPDSAASDIPELSAPFWDDPDLYEKGIDFYERLKDEFPGAWWLYHNVAGLAGLLGDERLEKESYARASSLQSAPAPRPNGIPVILLVVEALRADHLGAYGSTRSTSPNIDTWARSGRVFEWAFATSSWARPAFGTILTGQFPMRHGAGAPAGDNGETVSPLDFGVRSLAEILRTAGYSTAAMVNGPYLGPASGLQRGFVSYDHRAESGEDARRADEVVERMLSWIDLQEEQPFFLMAHLYDPHLNHDAPPPDEPAGREGGASTLKGNRERVRAAYDEGVSFVDDQLGRLRQGLAERDLLDSTLIVLAADHGVEFYDQGGVRHGAALPPSVLHVPLVVWGPGVHPGREPAAVSLADLAPTVLSALGLSPEPAMQGASLWPHLSTGGVLGERTLFAEGTLQGPQRWAAVRWPISIVFDERGTTIAAAELSTGIADPNLESAVVTELWLALRAHLRNAAIHRPD